MEFESLLQLASDYDLYVDEKYMPDRIKGLYTDKFIRLNKKIESDFERACVLAEEIGHYHTSYGDTYKLENTIERKQEVKARRWAHHQMIPPRKFISAHKKGLQGQHEIAEYLGVTEDFLLEAIDNFKAKYGSYIIYGHYRIHFDPLAVKDINDPVAVINGDVLELL